MLASFFREGLVVANEVIKQRAAVLVENLTKWGSTQVVVTNNDPSHFQSLPGYFDVMVIDAPCSGSGTWRRNPDRKWHFTPEELDRLIKVQSALIGQGARVIKPGGRLIYAVCSFLNEEGPDRVHEFLKLNPDFEILPGSSVWQEALQVPYPKDDPFLRLSPGMNNTDGFFIAILKRKEAAGADESA